LPLIFPENLPASILDVGCGNGTWLKAAADMGVDDYLGVDGVNLCPPDLLIPTANFRCHDLTGSWSAERKFEAALCLEVAEHVHEADADKLIDALVNHSDTVIFSAACPGQPGQHHVNCQWPAYWQDRFNRRGFACSGDLRLRMWNVRQIEPWYRQNIIVARRSPGEAGTEPRILPLIHPEMITYITNASDVAAFKNHVEKITLGRMPVQWYLRLPFSAAGAKLRRAIRVV
jgi:hypothetical protein